VGVFIGSAYGPNIDSYRLARQWLDQAGFRGAVLVVGRIAEVYDDSWPKVGFVEEWCGFVESETKRLIVSAADFGLNLVTGGGGTNLKLFDYMAAKTLIIANDFGARGVAGKDWYLRAESAEDMARIVRNTEWRSRKAARSAERAYEIALRDFDWSAIVDRYRKILQ
jgi:glycosyltransferase involved in cell wall biosynthesis